MAEENNQQEQKSINIDELANAVSARIQRAENSVVRSYSEQYGMAESEIRAILDKAKAEKESKPTAAQQAIMDKAIENANARLIAADVKAQGSALGIVDAEVALSLIDKTKIRVKDDGTVEGVKEALETLKSAKPYLFNVQSEPKKTGMRQKQSDGNNNNDINVALRSVFKKG